METHRITLSLIAAIEASSAVLPHISKGDDPVPMLRCASIEGNRIVATDRYTVGSFPFRTDLAETSRILLPREAVSWMSRIPLKNLLRDHRIYLDSYTLTIESPEAVPPVPAPPQTWPVPGKNRKPNPPEWDAHLAWREKQALAISVESERFGVEMLRKFTPEYGTFPAVTRMIDDFKPGTKVTAANVNPALLERFTGYAKRWRKNMPIEIQMSDAARDRPGPMRITSDPFVGLIQPNLLTR